MTLCPLFSVQFLCNLVYLSLFFLKNGEWLLMKPLHWDHLSWGFGTLEACPLNISQVLCEVFAAFYPYILRISISDTVHLHNMSWYPKFSANSSLGAFVCLSNCVIFCIFHSFVQRNGATSNKMPAGTFYIFLCRHKLLVHQWLTCHFYAWMIQRSVLS